MKKCSKCGHVKDLSEFHKDRTARDGLHSCCKVCDGMREKTRVRHRDQYHKQWRRDHPGYMHDWKESNKKRYDAGLVVAPDQKKCSYCGKIKSSDQFHTNRSSKDGLAYWCADCVSATSAGYSVWKKL